MSDLEYPNDVRYTVEHEWVRVNDDGTVRVGITSYAQDALGDVVSTPPPSWSTPIPTARVGSMRFVRPILPTWMR